MNAQQNHHLAKAESAGARGDRAAMLAAIEALLSQTPIPALGEGWVVACMLAHEGGDDGAAVACAEHLQAQNAADPRAMQLLAQALMRFGKADEAAIYYKRALDMGGADQDNLYYEYARSLAQKGDLAKASEVLDALVARCPDHAAAWENLAGLKRFSASDPQIAVLKTQRAKAFLATADVRASFAAAQAKAYDGMGEIDKAWSCLSDGARAAREIVAPFDPDAYDAYVDQLITSYAASCFAPMRENKNEEGPPVILILGVPRSGTTLIERVLGAHSLCVSAGENKALWLVSQLLGGPGEPAIGQLQDPDMRDLFRSRYLKMLHDRAGGPGVVTDKSLRNETRLGLAARLLPAIRVIWCRRGVMDTAFSCLKTRFAEGNAWSYTPEHIARFIAGYEKIMTHWQHGLGAHLYTLDFDAFVENPDEECAKLLGFCGLPFEPVHKSFVAHGGNISTASLAQVREPINKKGRGAWRRYESHLGPLRAALRAVGYDV